MTSAILALCAAMSWAVGSIFVRLGSRNIAPLPGVVLSLWSSLTVVTVALLIRGIERPTLPGVAIFALAGLVGTSMGRILSITSISKLGATRTAPLMAASQPIVTVILGIFVLAETIAISRAAGIALTLTGVLVVVRSGQRQSPLAPAPGGDPIEPGAQSLRVLLWPLAAGTAFAVADLIRKTGMQIMDDAFLGGVIGVSVALGVWGTVLVVRGEAPALIRVARSRDAKWFMASGAGSGAAQVFVLSALRDGDLSMVGPILAIQPILITIMARLFLNKLENVGWAVATAALLAGAGTVLISL